MKIKNKKLEIIIKIFCAGVVLTNMCIESYANGSEEVSSQVNSGLLSFVDVLLAVVAVIGIFILVKNIAEFSVAWNQQDNTGMFSAVKGIVSGALLISIKLIIKLFGVDV